MWAQYPCRRRNCRDYSDKYAPRMRAHKIFLRSTALNAPRADSKPTPQSTYAEHRSYHHQLHHIGAKNYTMLLCWLILFVIICHQPPATKHQAPMPTNSGALPQKHQTPNRITSQGFGAGRLRPLAEVPILHGHAVFPDDDLVIALFLGLGELAGGDS